VAGCVPPVVVACGMAHVIAAPRGVVEVAATDDTRGETRVVAAPCGVVEEAATAVACGETRVVDSGNCLIDLDVRDFRCAATRNLHCAAADLAFACATAATHSFSRVAFAHAWFLAANLSNTKSCAAPTGAVAVSIRGNCPILSNTACGDASTTVSTSGHIHFKGTLFFITTKSHA
jgi:hypothetical protein